MLWLKEVIWNCHQVEAIPYLIANYCHCGELDEIEFYDHDTIKTYQDLYAYKFVSTLDKSLQLINVTLQLGLNHKSVRLNSVLKKLDKRKNIIDAVEHIACDVELINEYRNAVTHRYSDTGTLRSILESLDVMARVDTGEKNERVTKAFRRINYSEYRHNLILHHTKYAPVLFKHIDMLFNSLSEDYEHMKNQY
jgi:hypothetical protein